MRCSREGDVAHSICFFSMCVLTARRLLVTGCSCMQLLLVARTAMVGHVSWAGLGVTAGDLVFCDSGLWVDCSCPGS